MPAIRVVDEHLLTPILLYSGSGGVFENELVLDAGVGLKKREVGNSLLFDIDLAGDSGILITSGSNGKITIAADVDKLATDLSKKYINEIVFNENVATLPEQIGRFFSLASTPTAPQSVQLWLNGQLLTYSEDYTVENRLITMLTDPLLPEDKLIASYSRQIILKQYAFGERLLIQNNTGTLKNLPVSSNDVMVFLNGQLLNRGVFEGDNDYHINDMNVTFNYDVDNTDVVLASYSYS